MDYSSSNETHTNESQTIEEKIKSKQRGAIMMTKLTKIYNSGNRLLIEFNNVTWTCYGTNYFLFRSYVAFLGRRKVNILIDDLTQLSKYAK